MTSTTWIKLALVLAAAGVLRIALGPVWWVPATIVLGAYVLQKELGSVTVAFIPWLRKEVKRQVLAPWQGKYYSFDDRQLRVFAADGAIWVAAADLLPLLIPKADDRELRLMGDGYRRVPGELVDGLRADVVTRMITRRTAHHRCDPEMIRLRNWWTRETLPNIERFGV